MAKKNKIRVSKVVQEDNPFMGDLSLREIARRTGLDVGYLSRVRSGEITIGEENLRKIWKAVSK